MTGKKKYWIKFKVGKLNNMSTIILTLISSKEDIGKFLEKAFPMYQKIENRWLIVDNGAVVEQLGIYDNFMHLSVFYSFCYLKDMSMDILE